MSADQPQGDGGRQSDLAVMEASEYKQKRRLREILDAHDHVEETVRLTYGEYAAGNISHDGKNIRILKAVQRYIREAHGVINEYIQQWKAEQARREKRFDGDEEQFQVESEPYWFGIGSEPLGVIERETEEDVPFNALQDVLFADEIYTDEWEEAVVTRNGPDQMVQKSATYTVPESVSIQAYLLLNEFLSTERDIVGLNFEDDSHDVWGFVEEEIDADDGRVVI